MIGLIWLTSKQLFNRFLIFFIVAISFVFRISFIDWDDMQFFHPDERYIGLVASTIEFNVMFDWYEGFDLGNMNPFLWPEEDTTDGVFVPRGGERLYAYGHAPLYFLVIVSKLLYGLFGLIENSSIPLVSDWLFELGLITEFHMIIVLSRILSAIWDTLTVVGVYLIGASIKCRRVGMIGALLYGVSVQMIQQAHFGTFDSMLGMVGCYLILMCIKFLEYKRNWYLYISGVLYGLAVGIKASGIFLFMPLVLSSSLRYWNSTVTSSRNLKIVTIWVKLTAIAVLVFAATNPYVLLSSQTYVNNIVLQSYMTRGQVDWPFILQYENTIPYLYQFVQQGKWFLGWPIATSMYGGALYGCWQVYRNWKNDDDALESHKLLLLVVWIVFYFIYVGGLYVKYLRYLIPIMSAGAVCGGLLLNYLWEKGYLIVKLVISIGLVASLLYAVDFISMYQERHPWTKASEWVYANVPRDGIIIREKWDHPLPVPIKVDDGVSVVTDAEFKILEVDPVSEEDEDYKLDAMLGVLENGDYMVVASNRNYGAIVKNTLEFSSSYKYYRCLFGGSFGFEIIYEASRYPELISYQYEYGGKLLSSAYNKQSEIMRWLIPSVSITDESFFVYDHPQVYIFQNLLNLDRERMKLSCDNYISSYY